MPTDWRDMIEPLGDQKKWILALLYAPDDTSFTTDIQGRTRLMKGAFLLSEKLDQELGKNTDFDFRKDKYGPFDPSVFEATEKLERENKIQIEEEPSIRGGDIYSLSQEGREKASEIWEELSDEEREVIKFIKYRHLQQPLSQILNYVYRKFPEYA